MEKFIALLRGVNVGGKNIVSMPILKAAFEKAGFFDVSTYINSGNIIFSSDEKDVVVLQQKCRQAILESFRLDIAVAVLSAAELCDALTHAPVWWGSDNDSKHNAIFVIAPANAESIIESVGQIKPEYEQVSHYGRAIFWSAPLNTFSHTRWSKIVSTSAYSSITIRNANTAKMLLQLSQ
ncbi:MAG: DUF1697 domain-containing protein [Oscillospiraceae bacterium]